MQSVTAVGFDMDYTLAVYKPETFEDLAYRLTIDKLVKMKEKIDKLTKQSA